MFQSLHLSISRIMLCGCEIAKGQINENNLLQYWIFAWMFVEIMVGLGMHLSGRKGFTLF